MNVERFHEGNKILVVAPHRIARDAEHIKKSPVLARDVRRIRVGKRHAQQQHQDDGKTPGDGADISFEPPSLGDEAFGAFTMSKKPQWSIDRTSKQNHYHGRRFADENEAEPESGGPPVQS